ncbi:large conductance mechanosensitive channel protein MscL [Streptomyces montanisoli]|uniref:large conductance mechanosensitive channel protein MscL n=1 Tax=Streptomyces montanisoli TaxID=2798581 RepID=UPI0027DCE223|nr:large conductance mechanosensitive channel protein MscL [Streptomyces montanisoli]
MSKEKDKESVLAGFKAFLMRGNVIDLAVAVVIGAAFTSIVNAVVKGVINPVVGAFGTQDLEQYTYCLQAPCTVDKAGQATHGIEIMWGTVLSSTLNFLITAAVVYFLMVLPMSRFLARRARLQAAKEQEPVETVVEDSELDVLKEIRDTLVSQRGPSDGTVVRQSR